MKNIFSKELCVWLVSPQDGTVRKIRLTSGKLFLIGILTCFFIGSFAYVASDYTRIQILRAKHYFNFKRLNNERGSLLTYNQDLRTQISSLSQEKARVLSFEQEVRQRLSELSNVLESASELGVVPPKSLAASDSTALGGAETDCVDSKDCKEENPGYSPSSFNATIPKGDLISQLEHSIKVTKQIPIGLPGRGFLSSYYGIRKSPFSGKLRKHQGVDFALPYGSSVYSTADGVVKSVKRNSTYGLKIDIAHGDTISTRYAHLSEAKVRVGDKVCRGQEIGLVGSSGRSTGPHLHYEVRVKNKPINPKPLFDLALKIQSIA